MNAVAQALGFGEVDAEHVSRAGHQCARDYIALARRLNALETQPATVAEVVGIARPNVTIGFAAFDATLADADKVLRKHPDAVFTMNAAEESLRTHADNLRALLATAKPWRALQK